MIDRFDHLYMDYALRLAQESYAKKLKVGAIAVKDLCEIASGYNGTVSGDSNICEDPVTGKTKPEVLHAEENLILKCARDGKSLKGATIYITHSPCVPCSRKLVSVGIRRVLFKEFYRDQEGAHYLRSKGLEVIQL